MKTKFRMLIVLGVALAVAACGGGSSSTSTTSSAATPGVSKGVITALGSVVVNGITYNVDNAAVKIDDNPSASDLLKVGMVVTVRGSADDNTKLGTASEVEARDALEGNITAVGAGTITVMGQTVRIEDNITRLNDDNNLKTFAAANFQVGQHVEIHGFPDDQGGLRATRVFKNNDNQFEVKGFVTSLGSPFGLSLTPGGAATLSVTGTLPAGAGIGSFVEVRGNADPAGNSITATSVSLEDALGAAGEKVEVEGIVSSGDVNLFFINGQKVITSAATLFEGGLKEDFAIGIKLEAEGPLDASGAILAVKVSFRSNIRIEADASAVSDSSLTLLGRTISRNSFTRLDNGPLANGQQVEVRATVDRDGNLLATRIVVKNDSPRAFVQGPVSAKDAAAGTLSIIGFNITTNASTQFRLSGDSTETPTTRAAFFDQLRTGVTVVKVRWASNDTALPIEEAEIEIDK